MSSAVNRCLAVVTAVSAAGVLAGPAPVRVAGGILLAFALPGLAVTGILFRGRDLSAVERVLLAPALSLAVLIGSGLVMYALGAELNRTAWTAATAGVALLALFAGALPTRRRAAVEADAPVVADSAQQEPAMAAATAARAAAQTAVAQTAVAQTPVAQTAVAQAAAPPAITVGSLTGPQPSATAPVAPPVPVRLVDSPPVPGTRSLRQVLPLTVAAMVLGGASWLAWTSARDDFETTVTALSVAPPSPINAAGLRAVPITVTGLVADQGPYRVVAIGANKTVIQQLKLPAGEQWTHTFMLPGRQRVTVQLFRGAATKPERTVVISATQ